MTGERKKPLVFLVDDDDQVLRSLRIALVRSYEVVTCNDAARSILEIGAKRPDVVVIDVKMPAHDGFWVFREVRKLSHLVPIIFNSAYQDIIPPDDITGAFAPFAYLQKNGNLSQFLGVIASAAKQASW